MIEKEIFFKNNNGKKLSAVLHTPSGEGPFPTVIICHGFKRDKKQIIPLVLSRNLSVNGFVVLRFDFQNCGESEGDFEDLTINQQIKDVYSAIDFIETLDYVDKNRMGLAGLSIGGSVAIIASTVDKRVKSLVAFSPGLNFSKIILKYVGIDRDKWMKQGKISFYDKGRDRNWTLKKTFWESCEQIGSVDYPDKIKIPFLLIQGDKDDAVSSDENKSFCEKVNSKKEYFFIKNCDHSYRQVDALHKAIKKATAWFLETL